MFLKSFLPKRRYGIAGRPRRQEKLPGVFRLVSPGEYAV